MLRCDALNGQSSEHWARICRERALPLGAMFGVAPGRLVRIDVGRCALIKGWFAGGAFVLLLRALRNRVNPADDFRPAFVASLASGRQTYRREAAESHAPFFARHRADESPEP